MRAGTQNPGPAASGARPTRLFLHAAVTWQRCSCRLLVSRARRKKRREKMALLKVRKEQLELH